MKSQAASAGFFEKTSLFISQVRTEMTKVTWPTKEQTREYTILVIVSSIAVTIAMAAWDQLLTKMLQGLLLLG
ncbi:MAG: preprotein translocase subunit SecE [Sumerlaeia bacterium]